MKCNFKLMGGDKVANTYSIGILCNIIHVILLLIIGIICLKYNILLGTYFIIGFTTILCINIVDFVFTCLFCIAMKNDLNDENFIHGVSVMLGNEVSIKNVLFIFTIQTVFWFVKIFVIIIEKCCCLVTLNTSEGEFKNFIDCLNKHFNK